MNQFKLVLFLFLFAYSSAFGQCWNLVWEDDFSGSSLDVNNWGYQTGAGGWGNNESQHYTSRVDNVNVTGGHLQIIAKDESFSGSSYTSGRIRTDKKADWTYGRFEASLKVPEGQGIWPALWMLPSDNNYGGWPASGEIDIMELLGHQPEKSYGTLHYGTAGNHQYTGSNYILSTGDFADAFHTFAIEWEPTEIRWYVDGFNYFTLDQTDIAPHAWVFDSDFHFIINVAVGGNWGGYPDATTTFPVMMEVDYVRVYKLLSDLEITGDDYVQPGESGITYATEEIPGATYAWTVPSGSVINSGQGTSDISITTGGLSGDVTCIITTACGSQSVDLPIEINPNIWENPDFESDYDNWTQVTNGGGNAIFNITTTNPNQGLKSAEIQTTLLGPNTWDLQISKRNFSVVAGETYEVNFWAKGDINGRGISVAFIHPTNFSYYGGTGFSLTDAWAKYTYTFLPTVSGEVRFNVDIGFELGTFYFDDFELIKEVFLPIELLDFSASVLNNRTVHLNWQTQSESNNDYFEVQRSIDAREFSTIDIVQGVGTSQAQKHYSSTDKNPLNEISYYRLKQVDFDGTAQFSEVISINLAKENSPVFYPNPADHQLFLSLGEGAEVSVFDVNGKRMIDQIVLEGTGNTVLEVAHFPTGIYFLKMNVGGIISTHRFLKK